MNDDRLYYIFFLIALVVLYVIDARERWKHQRELERLAGRSLWQKIRGEK